MPRHGAASADGESYCCSGCYLAHRLSQRGLEASTDRLLSRVVLCAFLAMGVMVFSLSLYGGLLHDEGDQEAARALAGIFCLGALAFSTPAMLLLGVPLADAVVRLRRWMSAEALILAGTVAAWTVSVWNTFRGGGEVYFDTATMVLLLYSVGRWLDVRARERATAELRRILPEREAPVTRLDDSVEGESGVALAQIRIGDVVRVRPGEVVPIDGIVLAGSSFADTAALTGESQPRSFGPGAGINAGITLVDGSLTVRATSTVGHRLRDEIERLLREALTRRARWVRIADRLAGALLPLVLVLAIGTVVGRWTLAGPEKALLDGLSVVLISCPCALGLATPLAYWTAIGAAWKRGVLVRSGEALEALSRVRRVLLDKTGTLTSGELELVEVRSSGAIDAREALRLAAALEVGSEHPIARATRAAWHAQSGERLPEVDAFRALPGIGVEGVVEGRRLALRGEALHDDATTNIALEENRQRLATLVVRGTLRAEAKEVVEQLRAQGLELAVLTGDAEGPAQALARELGVPVEARLSPKDKLERVRAAGRATAFVGDGLNDAAALAAAQVGISVAGSAGTSLGAAQVNLLRPGLSELPRLLALARATAHTAQLNLAWAFAYNGVGLWLAASGKLTPIFAASAMVVSSAFSVLNSARLRAERRPPVTAADGEDRAVRTSAYGASA